MKLRTEIVDGTVQDQSDDRATQWRNLEHDAMAAHALLQAMDEVGEVVNDYYVFPSNGITRVRERADEILKEWTGEVG